MKTQDEIKETPIKIDVFVNGHNDTHTITERHFETIRTFETENGMRFRELACGKAQEYLDDVLDRIDSKALDSSLYDKITVCWYAQAENGEYIQILGCITFFL